MATSVSTIASRQPLPTPGRLASVPEARSSPISHSTTFASSATTWKAGIAAPKDGSCLYQLFIDPPLARVGLSEREARDRGIHVRVATLLTGAVLRTRTTSDTAGFMKALVADDDRIVGFAMIGSDAGEVMAAVQVAMMAQLPYTAIRDAILTHPTMAEGLNSLFGSVPIGKHD